MVQARCGTSDFAIWATANTKTQRQIGKHWVVAVCALQGHRTSFVIDIMTNFDCISWANFLYSHLMLLIQPKESIHASTRVCTDLKGEKRGEIFTVRERITSHNICTELAVHSIREAQGSHRNKDLNILNNTALSLLCEKELKSTCTARKTQRNLYQQSTQTKTPSSNRLAISILQRTKEVEREGDWGKHFSAMTMMRHYKNDTLTVLVFACNVMSDWASSRHMPSTYLSCTFK